jgi:hypothetical protein
VRERLRGETREDKGGIYDEREGRGEGEDKRDKERDLIFLILKISDFLIHPQPLTLEGKIPEKQELRILCGTWNLGDAPPNWNTDPLEDWITHGHDIYAISLQVRGRGRRREGGGKEGRRREGGKEGRREGGKEGGKEGRREGGKEGRREGGGKAKCVVGMEERAGYKKNDT